MKRLVGIRARPDMLARILRPGTKLTLVLVTYAQSRSTLAPRTVVFSDQGSIHMDNGSCIALEPDDVIEFYGDGFVLRAPNGIETTYLWGNVQV
jgi:hypothetical protein